MSRDPFAPFTRTVRWRYRFAPRRYQMPVISPYIDRLRDAALGDHVCQLFVVRLEAKP